MICLDLRPLRMHSMPCLRSLLLLGLCHSALQAADWPQWLGPSRNGSTAETVSPWTTPPIVLWRIAVGEGHSSPIVVGNRVYLHTKVKDKEEEEVSAFNADTGHLLWSKTYP